MNPKENRILIIMLCCVSSLFFLCGCKNKCKPYEILPQNTELTIDILIKSEQIVKSDSDLILLYNFSNTWNSYEYYLLFFNSKKKLYAVEYFASNEIIRISNDTIEGILFDQTYSNKLNFSCEKPSKYQINLIKRKTILKSGRISNKIIDDIKLTDNFNAVLYIDYSENLFQGYNNMNSLTKQNFNLKDTLILPLYSLHFDYQSGTIQTRSLDENGYYLLDEMIINKELLINFYDNFLPTPVHR